MLLLERGKVFVKGVPMYRGNSKVTWPRAWRLINQVTLGKTERLQAHVINMNGLNNSQLPGFRARRERRYAEGIVNCKCLQLSDVITTFQKGRRVLQPSLEKHI